VPRHIMVRDSRTGLWEPTEHATWKDRARALESRKDLRKLTAGRYRVTGIERGGHPPVGRSLSLLGCPASVRVPDRVRFTVCVQFRQP
jgi:hypothetical protein